MKENFDLQYWLNRNVQSGVAQPPIYKSTNLSAPNGPDSVLPFSNDTETILSRIEATHIDLTTNYQDWIKIGFAFVNEHGEAGRAYFHRVSRFYPKYSYTECDKQYDACLREKNLRTTIKSFFYLAEQAGIDIVCEVSTPAVVSLANPIETTIVDEPILTPIVEDSESIPLIFNTPKLPTEIYQQLPKILCESSDLFLDGTEKDVFLVAAITVLSGCLPNIEGIYFEERYSAHLYLFITAPAGSGKGKMKWAKYLGQTIHDQMLEQSRKERTAYESELQQWDNLTRPQKQSSERPIEPKRKMFYIPANSSSSAFTQALADNNYRGVLFETEADTLAVTFKQDWGNFSDVLRKAFHHESTSMFRRKDNEYIDIKDPHLAIVLSGTPKQVENMIPDPENGLFSRNMYYGFEDQSEFKNPFVSHSRENYPEFFKRQGSIILDLYEHLQNRNNPITFKMTDDQGIRFTSIFDTMLSKDNLLVGREFNATVKRLGLITFRIAMVITALRLLEDGEFPDTLICSDLDFQTAITIAITLEKHAVAIFQRMGNNELKGKSLAFYEKLPEQFDRQSYLKVAEELGINPKTAERYIKLFQPKLLNHAHNAYTKITK
ncbi:MAG TPA: DUF3987 domain-containing protein [Prolixibacteraceae bacterium]|jgi:hypothetical protein